MKNPIRSFLGYVGHVLTVSSLRLGKHLLHHLRRSPHRLQAISSSLYVGKADVIVTEDDDLLDLNPFREIRLINPRDFLDGF